MTVSQTAAARRTPAEAMEHLAAAAEKVRLGWLPRGWNRVAGPGPDFVPMIRTDRFRPMAAFDGLVLEPGRRLELELELDLPEAIEGVTLGGDALQMTIESLYPMTLSVGELVILDDSTPVAASGAALIDVLPHIANGSNGTLRLVIRAPDAQLEPGWNLLTFGTPGLQRRFEMLDLALAQLRLATALARDDADRDALAAAAALVPDDLTASDDVLQPALDAVARELGRFDARAKSLHVHVIGHSHIDINWQWTWPDTVEVVRRDVRSVLSMMEDYPELRFVHSQPVTYEIIRQHEPELFQKVLAYIREGRWEVGTMQWVETDSNIPSGESHARQLQEGVAYTREVLGVEPSLFMAPDTFGHAGQVPQLAAQAGAKLYYHHRANPGNRERSTWPAYWFESQEGARVLAVTNPVYGGFLTATELADAAIKLGVERGHDHVMWWHGAVDHGGGPTRYGLDALRRLQNTPVMPAAECSTIAAYADAVLASGVELPVHHGETDLLWEGCYTTHADIKRWNRHGESLLGTAEALSALAGLDRVAQLRESWRKILLNQFHDIICGTAIRGTYQDCGRDFDEVRTTAERVTAEALDVLHAGIEAGRIAVTNPLGFDRTDLVCVPVAELHGPLPDSPAVRSADGTTSPAQVVDQRLLFVATVPAFGTTAYQIVEGDDAASSVVSVRTERALWYNVPGDAYLVIDTPHFEARMRPDSGVILSLVDKRVGRQLVGPATWRWGDPDDEVRSDLALNVFQLIHEEPHGMAAWAIGRVKREETLRGNASARLLATGPVCAVFAVQVPFGSSTLHQRIHFYSELARIDFQTTVDWNEPCGPEIGIPNLKVSFNATIDGAQAWYETPFGAARRPADGREQNAQRWADVGTPEYGVAILNESKYGYDALGSRLRLTLLRNAYSPDRESDTGHHEFQYSLVPHPGDWRSARIPEMAAGFNQPLLARVASGPHAEPHTGWRPRLEGDEGVLISSLKRVNAGEGIAVRLYEATGRSAQVLLCGLPSGARVHAANILEEEGDQLSNQEGAVDIALRAWEIRTLLVRP